MITLTKDGKKMTVSTELQASVFLRNGYTEVKAEAKAEAKAEEPVEEDAKIAEPKKRRRRKSE